MEAMGAVHLVWFSLVSKIEAMGAILHLVWFSLVSKIEAMGAIPFGSVFLNL
jgi:hypothetical protein